MHIEEAQAFGERFKYGTITPALEALELVVVKKKKKCPRPLIQHLRCSLSLRCADIHPSATCGADSAALGPALLL